MEIISEKAEDHLLELCALDKTETPPARSILFPSWDQICMAIDKSYSNGGFVDVRVIRPNDVYISQLSLIALPGVFRLIVLTRDKNPKNELLEWWESGQAPFRGLIRFGDDEWDSRTSTGDINVAKKAFHDLYKTGHLSAEILSNFHSQWSPRQ